MNVVVLTSVLFVLIVRKEASCGLVDGFLQGLSSGVSKETTTRASPFNLVNPFLSLNNERSTDIMITSTTQRVTSAGSKVGGVGSRLEDVNSCPIMMPMKKKKFYKQFQPVRPEDEVVHEEEVIYYLDAAPDIQCRS